MTNAARAFIEQWRTTSAGQEIDLPSNPDALQAWMQSNVRGTGLIYQEYLARRKAGGRREYFATRSHALHFLRSVAPTKLVDGAWLHGVLKGGANPVFSDLVFT